MSCGAAPVRVPGEPGVPDAGAADAPAGRVITTEQFLERIWGYDTDVEISVVWAYISYIRKKLEAIGANVRIATRRGFGYLLEEIS